MINWRDSHCNYDFGKPEYETIAASLWIGPVWLTVRGKEMTGSLKLPIIDLSSPDRISTAKSIRQVCFSSRFHSSRRCLLDDTVWFSVNFKNVRRFWLRFQACIEFGFFYLVNHGVEEELFRRVFEESSKLFSLPLEDKTKMSRKQQRGYTALYAENLDPSSTPKGHLLLLLLWLLIYYLLNYLTWTWWWLFN